MAIDCKRCRKQLPDDAIFCMYCGSQQMTSTTGGQTSQKWRSYLGALVLLGCLVPLPIVALIFTAAIYVAPPLPAVGPIFPQWIPFNWVACLSGFFITLALWLLVAVLFTGFSSAESAIPVSGSHLKNHFLTVQAASEALRRSTSSGTPTSPNVAGGDCIAREQVDCYVEEIRGLLAARGLRWIAGTGYLNAWNLVHRAEEAMISLEPDEEVIREAIYDESCLNGSPMEARDSALKILQKAVAKLSPSAMSYLDSGAQDTDKVNAGQQLNTATSTDDQGTAASNGTSTIASTTALEARNALRDVRRMINEYRDGLWEGVVSLRNRLMGTTLITGFSTYVLLCFAIMAGASPASIKAAIAFYLIGALVGLFGRLYAESQADRAADDYDLTLARIIVTPVLGGLAAVGGVLLTTMLSLTLLKAPTMTQTVNPSLGLAESFDLNRNALGVVIAAVFGLTPNLFINTLQNKAKSLMDQLQNTSASDQGKSGDKGQSQSS